MNFLTVYSVHFTCETGQKWRIYFIYNLLASFYDSLFNLLLNFCIGCHHSHAQVASGIKKLLLLSEKSQLHGSGILILVLCACIWNIFISNICTPRKGLH